MDISKEELVKSLNTGLINYRDDSIEDYRPKLIVNNYKKGSKVISYLIKELSNCNEFCFSVAFVTNSGINLLLNSLKELEQKGVHGRVLTTNYLNFNEPNALRRLLKFKNLDVRVYDDGNFHSKGYIFKNNNCYNFIIGSSNLSQEALTLNEEWNLKVTSLADGELLRDTINEFNEAWQKSSILTEDWILEYEKRFLNSKMLTPHKMEGLIVPETFTPNLMQKEAMNNLEKLRDAGTKKALLISATGTGKTYLSAFDVRQFNPKRMLFVIHREQIAQAAMDTFKNVFGNTVTMGIFSGKSKELECDFIFSTIQTLSKDENLKLFDPKVFDYIVIDEVHHAGAKTYQKIIDYFKPKFLLGMTATPDRTDGFNIYEMFDYNIAYEIRLQKALEYNMLCPFHYFGVSEIKVDGEALDEMTSFNNLISDARVEHIIKNAEFYGYDGDRVKGLIFCSRNEEAEELSKKFNNRGYRTVALSAISDQKTREEMVKKLEQSDSDGALDYIMTVDIFNEGIDIPKINQIIMLRPTESAIVFIQQLGRGLRKNTEKDFVVVIDFIGNYQKNFLIPVALSGDRTYKKDELRRFLFEGTSLIPGCSSITFEPIARENIYNSINKTNFSTFKFLKEKYIELKNKIGKVPRIIDFYNYGSVDPQLILDFSGSYPEFLAKVDPEDYRNGFNSTQIDYLRFLSKYISNPKRLHEILTIKLLLNNEFVSDNNLNIALSQYGIINDFASINHTFRFLSGNYFNSDVLKRYNNHYIAKTNGNAIKKTEDFSKSLSQEMVSSIGDLLEYAILNWQNNYADRHNSSNLCLYKKYSRFDACKLLNWNKDESMVIFGDPKKPRVNTYPIFVTYDKNKDISESIKYEDKFIDKDTFSWVTTNEVRMDSEEVRILKEYAKTNVAIQLFIKKNDDEDSGHYYMGNMIPIEFNPGTIPKKGKQSPVVNIKFRMLNSIRDDIYRYITE